MGDTVNHERLGQPLLLNADVDEKNSRRRTLTVVWWSRSRRGGHLHTFCSMKSVDTEAAPGQDCGLKVQQDGDP